MNKLSKALTILAGTVVIAVVGLYAYLTPALDHKGEGFDVAGSLDIDITVKGSYAPELSTPVLPQLDGKITINQLHIESPALLQPLRDGKLSIVLSSTEIALESFAALVGDSDLHLSGTVRNIDALLSDRVKAKPQLSFEMTSKLLDLDQMIPAE